MKVSGRDVPTSHCCPETREGQRRQGPRPPAADGPGLGVEGTPNGPDTYGDGRPATPRLVRRGEDDVVDLPAPPARVDDHSQGPATRTPHTESDVPRSLTNWYKTASRSMELPFRTGVYLQQGKKKKWFVVLSLRTPPLPQRSFQRVHRGVFGTGLHPNRTRVVDTSVVKTWL